MALELNGRKEVLVLFNEASISKIENDPAMSRAIRMAELALKP